MDEYNEMYDIVSPELPEDTDYEMTLFLVHKLLKLHWKKLADVLKKEGVSNNALKLIEEYDKLMDYWL